ncbi:MAG: hypothetical protein D6715_03320 [Calditrichaeota bacterium]|nr:MAG: hypothetical protein D6715_03320 [Calditrichota bacterium]
MQTTIQKPGKRAGPGCSQGGSIDSDLLLKLYELLEGERDMVRVYSKALQSEICFVNPAVFNPDTLETDCPVYTTRELAFVLSLSEEEFRRFHYLKTRLVG